MIDAMSDVLHFRGSRGIILKTLLEVDYEESSYWNYQYHHWSGGGNCGAYGQTDVLMSIHSLSANPTLHRTNQIRTIHGSLAIEQNTLSLEQVNAVLNGKHVLASPKDIAEVKNAYDIYERLEELNPYSVDDLLTAHRIMTRGLVEESGYFRSHPVTVVEQQGNILHFGTLPDYVPSLTRDLLKWAKNSEVHMLIRSCVFHYELEQIHPFADGNGRIGRL